MEPYRKIGKRDTVFHERPEDILTTPNKFDYSGAWHARASALAVTARMLVVAV
jgi:hypothetical protein